MGDQVDADFAAVSAIEDAVDGQTDAIDGDGALVGQVFGQGVWCLNAQLPAFPYLGEVRDMSESIHVAGDQMAAQAVVGAQGFFQVDRAQTIQAGGLVQRLGRYIHGEMGCRTQGVHAGNGHARAVDGNAVTQTRVIEVANGAADR